MTATDSATHPTKTNLKKYAEEKLDELRCSVTCPITDKAIAGTLQELSSPNPDRGNLAQHGAALLGVVAANKVVNRLEKGVNEVIDRASHGQLNHMEPHKAAMRAGMARAEALTNPALGISGTVDAGKALKSLGVTGVEGQLRYGIGSSGHGLGGKGIGAGVTVNLTF